MLPFSLVCHSQFLQTQTFILQIAGLRTHFSTWMALSTTMFPCLVVGHACAQETAKRNWHFSCCWQIWSIALACKCKGWMLFLDGIGVVNITNDHFYQTRLHAVLALTESECICHPRSLVSSTCRTTPSCNSKCVEILSSYRDLLSSPDRGLSILVVAFLSTFSLCVTALIFIFIFLFFGGRPIHFNFSL